MAIKKKKKRATNCLPPKRGYRVGYIKKHKKKKKKATHHRHKKH